MSTRGRGVIALLVLVLSGCSMPWPEGTPRDQPEMPIVEVLNGQSGFELAPWSGCISGSSSGFCWDGTPPEDPVDIGVVTGEVEVVSDLAGWRWQAMARPPSSSPGAGSELTIEHSNDGRRLSFAIPPDGPYAVDLSGWGEEGDAFYTFVASGKG